MDFATASATSELAHDCQSNSGERDENPQRRSGRSRMGVVVVFVALLTAGCPVPSEDSPSAGVAVQQQRIANGCDPRLSSLSLSEIADPLACVASAHDIERARGECERRDTHTELRRFSLTYICYSITVAADGWRTCSLSEPILAVRTGELAEPSGLPCGNTEPRYPVDEEYEVAERLWPPKVVAPTDCESAFDWYKSYMQSVERALIDEMSDLTAQDVGGADIIATYERIGHLLEQGGPRADAVRESCLADLGIDAMGVVDLMYETEDGLNEAYKTLVRECVAHGGIDCGVLAPTAKTSCEGMSPENVFLLDQETLDVFSLKGWPRSSRAIGCTLGR